MGGYGSGGHNKIKACNTCVNRIDIRLIKKWNWAPGIPYVWTWTFNGKSVGSIGFTYFEDCAILNYKHNGVPQSYKVNFSYTNTGYGKRSWFVCPGCGRNTAVLYGNNPIFKCRVCNDVNYKSSQLQGNLNSEINHRIDKIMEKLKYKDYNYFDGWAPRPKWMHCKTYKKLIDQLEFLFSQNMQYLSNRFGVGYYH